MVFLDVHQSPEHVCSLLPLYVEGLHCCGVLCFKIRFEGLALLVGLRFRAEGMSIAGHALQEDP